MIRFSDVAIGWENKQLLRDVSFHIPHGKKGVIVGPSGCGKSTLLLASMAAVPVAGGSITIDSTEVNPHNLGRVRRMAAHIGQEPQLCEDVVRAAIDLPFTFRANRGLRPSQEKIDASLKHLHLPASILDQLSLKVSGGEKRRLAIVRALLLEKSVFLLDEILTGLDEHNQDTIMNLFFTSDDITVLSVSHNPRWVERCDTTLTIANGTLVQSWQTEEPAS